MAAGESLIYVVIAGAMYRDQPDDIVNGLYDRVPSERAPGGAPVYKRRGLDTFGDQSWLFLARTSKWFVCSGSEPKDTREAAGFATTLTADAPGTLPHEAPAGGWEMWDGDWEMQPAITMTADAQE